MKIIKLTMQNYKTIIPTRVGCDNQELISEETILFNTNEMIMVESNPNGSTISYKKALVSSFHCKESLEEIYKLIEK